MSGTENTGAGTSQSSNTSTRAEKCTIVPLPKIVFFYPLMLVALVCGIMESFGASGATEHSSFAGSLFLLFF